MRIPMIALAIVGAFLIGVFVGVDADAQPTQPVSVIEKRETCHVKARTYNKLLVRQRQYGGPKVKRHSRPVPCAVFEARKKRLAKLRDRHQRRLRTDARYAITKAFAPLGRVSQALRVAYCESTMNRFARNSGGYSGLFQLGSHHFWRLRGKPYYHAYANARAAASIVAGDGGWNQWECKP